MYLEHFEASQARVAWQESIERQPSAWVWRNLAILAQLQGNAAEALDCLRRAWVADAASGQHTLALAQEYIRALCNAKLFTDAQVVYDSLPALLQSNDRIQILRGRIALELNDAESVEQAMNCEYAIVREGETELTDIWFEKLYRNLSGASNRALTESEKAEVRKLYPPPKRIDFRSIDG